MHIKFNCIFVPDLKYANDHIAGFSTVTFFCINKKKKKKKKRKSGPRA